MGTEKQKLLTAPEMIEPAQCFNSARRDIRLGRHSFRYIFIKSFQQHLVIPLAGDSLHQLRFKDDTATLSRRWSASLNRPCTVPDTSQGRTIPYPSPEQDKKKGCPSSTLLSVSLYPVLTETSLLLYKFQSRMKKMWDYRIKRLEASQYL